MKPIQQHKDPGIANISLDNFTGTICIITPISNNEDLMLSSPQTNGSNAIFNPNHHLTLITQPVLGARSRKKHHIDSITSTHRTEYTHSPSIISPIKQEKRRYHHESSDSGIDLSLSTNSSAQYPQQQYLTAHRPLSALNEDSYTDDQSTRAHVVNLGRNRSSENILNNNSQEQQRNRSSSLSDEREKLIKKSNDNTHLDTIAEVYQQTNVNKNDYLQPSTQQHRPLNDPPTIHTLIRKPNISTLKPLTKKNRLNIIIQPSSNLDVHDEQIHSSTRTTSSSSNQTTSHLIKPKAITPLGHYPNQEQIRAHINRSVIERQHPSYLSVPIRRGLLQQKLPFDASRSKVNHLLIKQQKPSTNNFHLTKQSLPFLYNDETVNDRQEKRNRKEKKRSNEINKFHDNSQKEQVRTKAKDIHDQTIGQQHSIQRQQNQIETFLTSTPRHHYEQDNHNRQITKNSQPNPSDKKQNINRQQQPPDPTTDLPIRNKNRTIHPNNQFELIYSPRNTFIPLQTHPTKLIPVPNIQSQFEQKSPIGSMSSLLQTARIQPTNSNNQSKTDSTQTNRNRFFQTRSPTSWSVISDHQINQQQLNTYETSSSSSSCHQQPIDDKSTRIFRVIIKDRQQPMDGRYVIPSDKCLLPLLVDSPSQTSSNQTHPFTYTPDSENNNNVIMDNSPHGLLAPNNSETIFTHRSVSSSSLDQFCPNDRFPLLLGKLTVAREEDDISTNYDSDDGWSDDSAELIYIDEHYATRKKKITSSSHLISKQHSHLQALHKNILLQ